MSALDDAIATIATRWPALALDRDRFAAALDERGLRADSPRAADIALASALAAGDAAALAVFDAEIVPDIKGALVRFGRDDDFVAEVLQRVRVKLLVGEPRARIDEYRGRGPLAAWIQIVAIREALMIQRAHRREQPAETTGDEDLVRVAITEPVLARTRQLYKEAFATAFRAAVSELGERDRTLLRLCFVENAGAEDLARLFRVHRVTAFRWLRDAREALLERTRTRFLASTEIAASEVDSVMRSLATSLTVSW